MKGARSWRGQAIQWLPHLLAAGETSLRDTPISGAPRAPYCMMGVCFDCLMEIDGVGNRQACLTPVAAGMQVRRQHGARGVQ